MKNRLISFIIIVTFLLSIVFKARAESELTVDDRAQIGEIYSLEKLKKFDEALFKIDDLLKRYPDNREVKWTYARLLGFSGKWKDSSDVFDDLCARGCEENELLTYAHILQAQGHDPETLEYMKKLADTHPDDKKIQAIYTEMLVRKRKAPTAGIITAVPVETVSPQTKRVESLISEQKFDQALDELENILSASPEDEAALLWKARILSWRGRYASSVQTYEHLISVHPDRAVYYRECGRVLGWSGKYGRAERIYNKAADRFPENKGLQAEALAKKAYYHDLFFVAEKRYQDWLNYEPENPEALFDLGQIYARSKRYTEAEAVYAKLVKNYSDNAQARRTREKADIFAHAMSTDTGVLSQEIDSPSRPGDLPL